jgi:hypothetical protein
LILFCCCSDAVTSPLFNPASPVFMRPPQPALPEFPLSGGEDVIDDERGKYHVFVLFGEVKCVTNVY